MILHVMLYALLLFFFKINYFCLGWIFVAMCGLSLAAVSGD